MAKDALGHGSEGKGGGGLTDAQKATVARLQAARSNPNHPLGALVNAVSGSGNPPIVNQPPEPGKGAHSVGITNTPQLQRRHFEAIAADLKSQAPASWGNNSSKANSDANGAHMAKVNDMADKLSTTNPGFRRDFFVKAATPGGGYKNKTDKSSRADVQKKAAKFTGGSPFNNTEMNLRTGRTSAKSQSVKSYGR